MVPRFLASASIPKAELLRGSSKLHFIGLFPIKPVLVVDCVDKDLACDKYKSDVPYII